MDETLEHQSHDVDMPLASNSNVTSSSDSDTDSDSDSDEQQNLQLQTLEQDLSTNPSNYDAHIQYIKLLRRMGLIEKLRSARELMSSLFPLSPDLWQEWTKDEISLATGPDAFSRIEKLYEKGISDYQSVSLWCDYISFIKEHDRSDSGIEKVKNLFERALTATGLHVMDGGKIWEAYREYEQAILQTIDDADTQAKEKQIQHIRSIFHRQLSFPLADSHSTFKTYKAWEVEQGTSSLDGISPLVASAYQKALQMYNARAPFEEKISENDISDPERLQNFMNYLKFELSSGDPARAASVIRDVYSRATKNCPWVGQLWVRYLLALERGHASAEEIYNVVETSLTCTLSSFQEYLDVFLTRIDGLRRRLLTALEGDNIQELALIRETCQRAVEYLSPHLRNTDDLLRLHSYWAKLELTLWKDLDAARTAWESLIKTSGSMLAAWLGYIAMEVGQGNINKARSLYRRCYSRRFTETGSEEICASWLRFEREYGKLEDFDLAAQKVAPRLEELRLFKLQQDSKSSAVSTDQTQVLNKKALREKRKPADSDSANEQPSAKKKKGADQRLIKGDGNNVSQSTKDVELNRGGGKEVNVVQSSTTKPDEDIKKHTQPKAKVFEDKCTAFISNLNVKATPEDLQKFFKDVGGVKDIRILKDKFTKVSRGLAYVDFCDDDHLAAAVAKNRKLLLGKKISIARSNPKRGKESGGNNGSAKGGEAATKDHGQGDGVQLKGKNTFAVPRNVRLLGLQMTTKRPVNEEEGEAEKPKSNDEFRKMFLKE
ncbi:unnamed protein product [Rhodiola kirilowii]